MYIYIYIYIDIYIYMYYPPMYFTVYAGMFMHVCLYECVCLYFDRCS